MTNRDFMKCQACGGWTRADIAGTPARCTCCGRLIDHLVVTPVTAQSPITTRRVFRSASLRDLQTSTP